MSTPSTPESVRENVFAHYAGIAEGKARSGGCCGVDTEAESLPMAQRASAACECGYSDEELSSLPEGADLGLGCGNPTGIADLNAGETVLDLGSGAGIDCFLAAKRVGDSGRVIGVDMTPAMVSKARHYARESDAANVEFRLGEIEHIPAADATVDVIISNCVINLSPEAPAVLAEAFRVLKPGGRLAVADIVATQPLPEAVRADLALHAGCIAGAILIDKYKEMLAAAGFADIVITPNAIDPAGLPETSGVSLADYVASAVIKAEKPA